MEIAANSLLAIGASPIMSYFPEEMVESVSKSDALSINLGTLDLQLIKASRIAAAAASQFGKPWVLDPVGAGFTSQRLDISLDLALNYSPTIIRGNASEIIALASAIDENECNVQQSKGVDSVIDSKSALDYAKSLAKATGATISVSGQTDYITDGNKVSTICNGAPIMPRVTALGCTATVITAAFAAIDKDPFDSALFAMALMGICGELTNEESTGTGTFKVKFIDKLSTFDPNELGNRINTVDL